MSFSINIGVNLSEDNKVNKIFNIAATITGVLKDESSIIDPVIIIDWTGQTADLFLCNYLYVADFNRYYFIKNITAVNNKLYRIECHVDVLMSFKSEFAACYGITQRQENRWNLYLNDGSLKVYQDRDCDTWNFLQSGLNSWSYVLLVAGGMGS